MQGYRCFLILVTVVASCHPLGADAQTTDELNAGIELSFRPPGARSLALGGAFTALADDATAAFANPAGLTILRAPELSFEGRNTTFITRFTTGGSSRGFVSNRGVDTLDGLVEGRIQTELPSLSFASLVYPVGPVTVGVYRHELANFEARIESQGAFIPAFTRLFPVEGTMDLRITNYGLSAGVRLGAGISLGAGVSYYDFEIDSTTRRYWLDVSLPDQEPGSLFAPPLTTPGNVINLQRQQGRDEDWGINAGFVWRLSEGWRIGASFRQGPRFGFEAAHRMGAKLEELGQGTEGEPFPAPDGSPLVLSVPFRVPDVLGGGIVWQPSPAWTFAADTQWVRHSQRIEELVDVFGREEFQRSDFALDDGTEYHLGIEWVALFLDHPLAFRAGAWIDPDHRVRFVGAPSGNRYLDASAALFRAGSEEVHFTFGIGWVLGRFQIDLASDLSDLRRTTSLSAVVRF